jgi:hypothetical protein
MLDKIWYIKNLQYSIVKAPYVKSTISWSVSPCIQSNMSEEGFNAKDKLKKVCQ